MPVWHPVIQLEGTATVDDDYEAAEEYRDDVGQNDRIVVVEAGEGARDVYVERQFESGGGWKQIGREANPNEDYIEVMIEMVEELSRDGIRMVYDYTNEDVVLEAWVEPEE